MSRQIKFWRLWRFIYSVVDLFNALIEVVTLGFYFPSLDMWIRSWHIKRHLKSLKKDREK